MPTDGWSPIDYAKFRDARRKPYFHMLSMLQPSPNARVLDVGCGTGELTTEAHAALKAKETIGVDSSPNMLAQAHPAPGVTLVKGSVPSNLPAGPFDIIISNSTLNWIDGHSAIIRAFKERLAPKGQLAVQVPSNPQSAFSRCCIAVAQSEPFATELKGYVYRSPVEEPERYTAWLDAQGFEQVEAGAWLYPLRHASYEMLVEFAKGGLLSPYRERLPPDRFEAFCQAYGKLLLSELGPGTVFFNFRRVFFWGRLGG